MAFLLRAVQQTRYGSVEIVIHAGRVVQIERREKVRFDEGDRRLSDHRGRKSQNHDRTDRSSGGFDQGRGDVEMKRLRWTLAGTLVAAAVILAAPLAMAQDQPKEGAPVPADKPAEKPAEKKAPPVSAGPEGFSLQYESGDLRLQLRGYAQFDGRFFSGDEGAVAIDQFLLRRVRPVLQGSVGRYVEFNIMPDFGGGVTVLQDAWIDFKTSPRFRVRVGKFKGPVGLERLQSATALTFVERAFPTLLVPNRDVGIQLHGELGAGVFAYAAGIFDGAPDGGSVDGDTNDGKDFEGRVFISPFKKGKSALKDLGFGIAGTTGKQSGPLPAYRSAGQISVITILTGITADGTRNRLSPQLSFYTGPFVLLGEYAQSESWVKKADGNRAKLEGSAWEVTGSVALTGDKASFAGVKPKKPFDPSKGQWGAVELAARAHGLKLSTQSVEDGLIDPSRSAREVSAWAVGLNWSLTRNLKQVVDFEHASFKGGASGGKDRKSENVIFIRTQVAF